MVMDNDANAAALAEHYMGSGQGVQEMVYVTVSTGIGTGIITRGRLIHGARGGAGEAGHTTIKADGTTCSCGRRALSHQSLEPTMTQEGGFRRCAVDLRR